MNLALKYFSFNIWLIGLNLRYLVHRLTIKRTKKMTRIQEFATEIKNQIGGQALFLLGAKNLACGDIEKNGFKMPYLGFKIRGSKKANYIRVILDEGSDTYFIQFIKYNTKETVVVCECSNVYAEDLHSLIESNTGLYTHF